LEELVSGALTKRGETADSEQLVKKLDKVAHSKLLKRFENAEDRDLPNMPEREDVCSDEEMKRKMRAESAARRNKAKSNVNHS
jgi:hypothetical protein